MEALETLHGSDHTLWRRRPLVMSGVASVALIGLTTAAAILVQGVLSLASIPLLFLIAVVIASAWLGLPAGLVSAVLAFLAMNFFFVEPYYTLGVDRPDDWLTLVVLLSVGALVGFLVGRLREETDRARRRLHALGVMERFAGDLERATTPADILNAVTRHGSALADAVAVCRTGTGGPSVQTMAPAGLVLDAHDLAAAERAARRQAREEAAAPGWPGNQFAFEPVAGDIVVGLRHQSRAAPEYEAAARALCQQARLALDKLETQRAAREAEDAARREGLRSALLSSLSHDLRTPLATILGGVSSLRELGPAMSEDGRADTLRAVEAEAERLARYVNNLLNLTRLKAGFEPRLDWADPDDVARAAVARARRAWPGHAVRLALSGDMALVRIDAALLEQALFNVIQNAVEASPAGEPVLVSTARGPGSAEIRLSVADRGPGMPSGSDPSPTRGAGLGLVIVDGILAVFGGRRLVENPEDGRGGTVVHLVLPTAGAVS